VAGVTRLPGEDQHPESLDDIYGMEKQYLKNF